MTVFVRCHYSYYNARHNAEKKLSCLFSNENKDKSVKVDDETEKNCIESTPSIGQMRTFVSVNNEINTLEMSIVSKF